MALAKNILQGGFSAGQSKAINGAIQATVTAAGTVITDATDLTADINYISTAAASTGVQMAYGEIGDTQMIYNGGANAVKVYPPSSSHTINQLSAGSAFSLAPSTACIVAIVTTTKCVAFLSA